MTTQSEQPNPPPRKPLNWVRPESRVEKPDRAPEDVSLRGLRQREKLTVPVPRGAESPPPVRPRMSGPQRALLALAILAVVAGAAWWSLIVLTPIYGEVVGYADQQPSLELIQPPVNPGSPEAVRQIRGVAQLYLDYHTDLGDMYWPEPSTIVERPTCWLVAYERRVPIYEFLGFRQIVAPTDKYMFLSIEKADLSLRFGKWCE